MGNENNLYAYAGKILRVNLSNGEIHTEPTSKYAKEWLGSSGIAVKILYDELRPWVTPYDPANRFIISAGTLVGTTAPGANKMNISTLGPMIGGWASSCSDTYFGGQMKRAGYDSIVFQGKAHRPVYLWIEDDVVEIRDASHLWGKTTWETLETIRETHNDSSLHTLSIGPGGENLVRGACVIQDKSRAFGRGGMGAVMGSKNLKAIVVRGSGAVKVAEKERFMKAATKCRTMFKGMKSENFHKYGTLGIMQGKQAVCGIAYKNFQDCHLPDEMAESIDPKHTIEKYQVSKQSYPGCGFGGCSRIMHITDGPYAGLVTESNQWEVVSTLQGRFAVEEPTFMYMANTLCNEYGLDIDSAGGGPIGWAMECFEKGIIDEKDTDGLTLEWGNAEVALELIRKIAYREGFGNILAEGCARAADIIGRDSAYYAMHIKGLDLYEPCRGSMGWSLGATTSTRGGGHTTGGPIIETMGDLDVEKAKEVYGIDNPHIAEEYDNKAKMVTFSESLQRANNCLGVCHYNTSYFDPNLPSLPELAELYSAATGWETSVEDLKRLTLKQVSMEKALNLRFTSFDRKDDMPTQRDLKEPLPTGNLAGLKIDEAKYNKMLDEYYDLHGWDRETSFPKRETLIDLDLEYVADDLESLGKLC